MPTHTCCTHRTGIAEAASNHGVVFQNLPPPLHLRSQHGLLSPRISESYDEEGCASLQKRSHRLGKLCLHRFHLLRNRRPKYRINCTPGGKSLSQVKKMENKTNQTSPIESCGVPESGLGLADLCGLLRIGMHGRAFRLPVVLGP